MKPAIRTDGWCSAPHIIDRTYSQYPVMYCSFRACLIHRIFIGSPTKPS